MTPPDACHSMAELRTQIDTLDSQLVELLALRSTYVSRAAELKPAEGLPARIGARIDEVIRGVRANADKAGLDPDLAETLWREVIEWSIRHEETLMADTENKA